MNKLLAMLLSTGLTPLIRTATALMGPTLRGFNLDTASLDLVLQKVGDKFLGSPVTYAAMAPYTAAEQQEIVEGLHGTLQSIVTFYGLVLTPAQLDAVLSALGAQIAAKYPQLPAAA